MSTTYGTSKSVTIPSDGDTIDAVDVNVPIAAMWDEHDVLADLTALQAILVPTHGLVRYVRGYGHYVFVTSGTYSASTAASPWILTATDGTAGRWVADQAADTNKTVRRVISCADANPRGGDEGARTWDPSAYATYWPPTDQDGNASTVVYSRLYFDYNGVRFYSVNAAAALGRHLLFCLDDALIHGATINSVTLYLQGAAGHGALPAMMPSLGLARWDYATDTFASLVAAGVTVDSSANVAAYEAAHNIIATVDQNSTVDRESYHYFAVVCNEGNTNALAQLRLRTLRVSMATKGYM